MEPLAMLHRPANALVIAASSDVQPRTANLSENRFNFSASGEIVATSERDAFLQLGAVFTARANGQNAEIGGAVIVVAPSNTQPEPGLDTPANDAETRLALHEENTTKLEQVGMVSIGQEG